MAFWISLALSPYQLAASVSWGQFLAGLAFLPAGAVLAVTCASRERSSSLQVE